MTSAGALVTGAADDLGRGCAQALCDYGFNVILHDRDRPKSLLFEKRLNKNMLLSKTKACLSGLYGDGQGP